MSSSFPTESNHFTARYQPWLGLAGLILGIASILLTVWSMLLAGKFNSAVIVGVILAIAGFLYLTRPYFTLAPNRLTVYSPLGKVVKRYPFLHYSDLKIQNDGLYLDANGQSEKVKITPWMVKSKDWQTLKTITASSPNT